MSCWRQRLRRYPIFFVQVRKQLRLQVVVRSRLVDRIVWVVVAAILLNQRHGETVCPQRTDVRSDRCDWISRVALVSEMRNFDLPGSGGHERLWRGTRYGTLVEGAAVLDEDASERC